MGVRVVQMLHERQLERDSTSVLSILHLQPGRVQLRQQAPISLIGTRNKNANSRRVRNSVQTRV